MIDTSTFSWHIPRLSQTNVDQQVIGVAKKQLILE